MDNQEMLGALREALKLGGGTVTFSEMLEQVEAMREQTGKMASCRAELLEELCAEEHDPQWEWPIAALIRHAGDEVRAANKRAEDSHHQFRYSLHEAFGWGITFMASDESIIRHAKALSEAHKAGNAPLIERAAKLDKRERKLEERLAAPMVDASVCRTQLRHALGETDKSKSHEQLCKQVDTMLEQADDAVRKASSSMQDDITKALGVACAPSLPWRNVVGHVESLRALRIRLDGQLGDARDQVEAEHAEVAALRDRAKAMRDELEMHEMFAQQLLVSLELEDGATRAVMLARATMLRSSFHKHTEMRGITLEREAQANHDSARLAALLAVIASWGE